MYKRNTLSKRENNIVKKKDEKARRRNIIMNFRVTEDEKNKINKRAELSGLSRQDFFIQSLINQKVICIGNVKSFEIIKRKLLQFEEKFSKIQNLNELENDELESLRMILELYHGLNEE